VTAAVLIAGAIVAVGFLAVGFLADFQRNPRAPQQHHPQRYLTLPLETRRLLQASDATVVLPVIDDTTVPLPVLDGPTVRLATVDDRTVMIPAQRLRAESYTPWDAS
jgi:hypothetical protein